MAIKTKRELIRLCKIGGLEIEGDESQEELYEAYIYLRNYHGKRWTKSVDAF